MSVIGELQENLEALQTAGFVTTMLRDISATKLQAIRAAFDMNSLFYREMHQIDALVQTYALRHSLANKKEAAEEKQIFLALTSNRRFYGTINREIAARLLGRMEKDSNSAYLMIGQTGKQILEFTDYASKCGYWQFEDEEPTKQEILELINILSEYNSIYVFYPTYINPFRQEVTLIDITHKAEPEFVEKVEIDYIFEPDIDELISFFETQVRLILFNRVLLETKLAQTGARLTRMQRARDQAEDLVKEQRAAIHKEVMAIQNKRLLETFAGFQKK